MERTLPTRSGPSDGTGDAAVYLVLLAVGLVVVIPTFLLRLPFERDATAGAVFVIFSVWGIASDSWDNVAGRK